MNSRVEAAVGIILMLAAVAVAIVFLVFASRRSLTDLELVLFQSFSLFASLVGAFVFGRQFAKGAARQMLKPHARSAFRRLLSLYQSMSRLGAVIESACPSAPGDSLTASPCERALEVARAIVVEQISTADDALEDWNDLVPEDVAEIRQRTEIGLHPLKESPHE